VNVDLVCELIKELHSSSVLTPEQVCRRFPVGIITMLTFVLRPFSIKAQISLESLLDAYDDLLCDAPLAVRENS